MFAWVRDRHYYPHHVRGRKEVIEPRQCVSPATSQSTRFETERLSTTDQRRIAAAMEQIGRRRERPEGKTRQAGWVPAT